MRLSKNLPLLAIALALGITSSLCYAAPIVIDDFDTTTQLGENPMVGIFRNAANPLALTVSDGSAGVNAMFGNVRNVTLGNFTGPAGHFVSTTVAGGVLIYASTNNGNSDLTIVYNSGGADLSGSIGLTFEVVDFDLAFMQNMDVTLTITSGMDSASSTQTLDDPGMQSLSWLYSGFNMGAGIGNVDLNNITQITVFFNGQVAHDFTIDNFQTIETVPEPASILTWGLVIGIGVLARRRLRSTR